MRIVHALVLALVASGIATPASSQGAPQPVQLNLGGGPNDRTGAPARTLFQQLQGGVNGVLTARGAPGGFAGLDANGLVPLSQMPLVGSLNATAAGKRAVTQSQADDLNVARPDGAQVRQTLSGILASLPLSLTNYGAASGQDATAALQAAINDCGATGRAVFAPAGVYIFTGTSNFPTAPGQDCPGVYGEGDKTIFAIVDYNGPIIRASLLSGQGLGGKVFANINTQGQWSSPSSSHDQAALLQVTGGQGLNSPGLSYSHFKNLGGYAIDHIVEIGTEYGVVSGDGKESYSGWLDFEGLYGGSGSQGFQVDSYVLFTKGSSTGSTFTGFRGSPGRAFLRYQGEGYVVGDIVVTGGQSGTGRVISIGPNTTYNRNIYVNGTQVDASSIEVMQWDGGTVPPSRIKLTGSFGGTNPWASIPPMAHSAIHGLGESVWSEGGILANYSGTANGDGSTSYVSPMWIVTLFANTLTRVEVSVTGQVGGVDGGGVVQVNDLACGPTANPKSVIVSGNQVTATMTSPPAGWPALVFEPYTQYGYCQFKISAAWRDTGTSQLATNITARHGRFKLNRIQPYVPL